MTFTKSKALSTTETASLPRLDDDPRIQAAQAQLDQVRDQKAYAQKRRDEMADAVALARARCEELEFAVLIGEGDAEALQNAKDALVASEAELARQLGETLPNFRAALPVLEQRLQRVRNLVTAELRPAYLARHRALITDIVPLVEALGAKMNELSALQDACAGCIGLPVPVLPAAVLPPKLSDVYRADVWTVHPYGQSPAATWLREVREAENNNAWKV